MRVLLGLSALNWTDRAQQFMLFRLTEPDGDPLAERPLFMAAISPCLNTDEPKEKQQPGAYDCGVASWGGPIEFKSTALCCFIHDPGVEVRTRWQPGGTDEY